MHLRYETAVLLLATLAACAGEREAKPPEAVASEKPSAQGESAARTAKSAQPDKAASNDGYEIIRAKTKSGDTTDIAVKPPEGFRIAQPPTSADPHGGQFTLREALAELPAKGKLVATLHTGLGAIHCDLYEDEAPNTVANFVGLARGLRKYWDEGERAWVGKPYYDGTTFHRVIPGFMIQGGDRVGDGSGRIWYRIPDELHPSLKHDRAGQLCMANRGPHTNEAQFFITEGPAPHLDASYTIFGQCTPASLVYRIARVPQSGPNNRPITPVVIERVTVARVTGGASALASDTAAASDTGQLPKNEVPGVAPPGRAVEVGSP